MHRRTNSPRPRTLTALALIAGLPMALTPATLAQNDEPMAGETLLPVRKVTLYRSGVGAFERRGTIDGSGTVALRFETDQINDILKSMVLLDLDGGQVSSVGYGSQEPLERRLASFAIDLSGNPSVVSLLRQLRGAEVTLKTLDGRTSGVVLSTENRNVKADDGSSAGTAEFVTLMTDEGEIVSFRMDDVRSFQLRDQVLQAELTRALTALGESRADRTKSVELRFDGAPGRPRRVVVAYVNEMPVWKTSYRLVLDDGDDDPSIYGWAIVENTTDHDWEDVTLSLASGRPVGFTMNLYQPLFAPRPDVPVPFLAGIAPQLYESATNLRRARSALAGSDRAPAPAREAAESGDLYSLGTSSAMDDEAGFGGGALRDAALAEYMPGSQASSGFAGEQFMYTVDAPVTIERRRSAMLPILTSTIEGRRVSIYNPGANATNPMRGVELTNDTGLHLMPGPIAVFDAGAYAGDAQIPHTSRNQTRLLSYAVDLPVRCDAELTNDSNVTRLSIDNGMLVQSNKNVRETTYTFENSDERKGRTLLVEHPRYGGWDLVTPKEPSEKLSNAYRFEVELGALGEEELKVREEYVSYSRYELVHYDIQRLQILVRRGVASQDVLDAVKTGAEMTSRLNVMKARVDEIRGELQAITRDQSRLRENIKTVREGSELYSRYLDKLTTQEDRIEALNAERDQLEGRIDAGEAQLRAYLKDLDVE